MTRRNFELSDLPPHLVEANRDVLHGDPAQTYDLEGAVIKLTVPYPPSANRYWRVSGNRVYRSTEAKNYKKQVQQMATLQHEPISGDLAVTLYVYRPRRSGDLDNRIKCLLDSLQGAIYHDDKQIVEIHAYRMDDKHNPRVEVEVTAV